MKSVRGHKEKTPNRTSHPWIIGVYDALLCLVLLITIEAVGIDMSRVQSTSTRHALDISIATAKRQTRGLSMSLPSQATLPKRNKKSMM